MVMEKANQVSSVFWLILGLAITFGSYEMGLGTLNRPGPGFLPFWCGGLLVGLSVLVFVKGMLSPRGAVRMLQGLWGGTRWYKGVYVVAALLIYNFTFAYLGFILSTILLLFFLFKAIEPQKWSIAIAGAVVASLAAYVLFARWLDVQLPVGIVEKILF
jgi:putative tricarboxylic transport membrane protein